MILEANDLTERNLLTEEKQEERVVEINQNEGMEMDISFNERLSNAEMFYLHCTLKNPKDVWNEFAAIDTNSFDTTKLDIFLRC